MMMMHALLTCNVSVNFPIFSHTKSSISASRLKIIYTRSSFCLSVVCLIKANRFFCLRLTLPCADNVHQPAWSFTKKNVLSSTVFFFLLTPGLRIPSYLQPICRLLLFFDHYFEVKHTILSPGCPRRQFTRRPPKSCSALTFFSSLAACYLWKTGLGSLTLGESMNGKQARSAIWSRASCIQPTEMIEDTLPIQRLIKVSILFPSDDVGLVAQAFFYHYIMIPLLKFKFSHHSKRVFARFSVVILVQSPPSARDGFLWFLWCDCTNSVLIVAVVDEE